MHAEGAQTNPPASYDVLIITTRGLLDSPHAVVGKDEPFEQGYLDVNGTIQFRKLPQEHAQCILDACRRRGFGERVPHLLAQQISIVRRNPHESATELRWDSDNMIQNVLSVSRFIHSIPVGLRYGARVYNSKDGKLEKVFANGEDGRLADAYCALGGRFYLTKGDAERIKELYPLYREGSFPSRVQGAMWFFDYLFYERYENLRWLMLCTAAEALVHTDRSKSTTQFSRRLAKLATEMGISEWPEERLRDVYGKYRSAVAHGQDIMEAERSSFEEYVNFENFVRRLLVRCIEEPQFREMFGSDKAVRDSLPI